MNTHVDPRDVARYAAEEPRLPPASIETEQGVLGCILVHPAALADVGGILQAEHFYEESHRQVFAVMLALVAAGSTVSLHTVTAALGTTLANQDIGGVTLRAYLARLAGAASPPASAVEHANIVRDFWILRKAEETVRRASDGGSFIPGEMVEEIFDRMDELRALRTERKVHSVMAAQAADELVAGIAAALRGEVTAVPTTGITRLDHEIGGGLQPATLITGAARTSMGKSIFGCGAAERAAQEGFGAIIHTLEMSRGQVMARIISDRLFRSGVKIPFKNIMQKRGLDQRDAELVAGVAHDLRGLPLRIEDGGGRTIADISAASERAMNTFVRQGRKPGLVVIDHAHIVRPSRAFKREDEGFKEVCDGALALAKRLECCVLLLAQCNRNTEARAAEERRPQLSDIRGAGAFEENSDAVIFLYRPAYYVERSSKYRSGEAAAIDEFEACRNQLEIIIDKNRMGQANQVVQAWIDPALNAIRNLHGA